MANTKWFILAVAPLLAAATPELSAQELAADDECRADSVLSLSPACALSALQVRQGVAMGDASAGAGSAAAGAAQVTEVAEPSADDSVAGGGDSGESGEEEGAAASYEGAAPAAPAASAEDLSIMSHLALAAVNESDDGEDGAGEAADDCEKDTGGSCRFMTCDSTRNAFCKKGSCRKNLFGYDHCYYQCLCPQGYCARNGACYKSALHSAAGGGRVSSQEISDVKNHFGLSTKQINLCVKEFVSTDQGAKGYITADDLVADVQKRGKQISKAQMQSFISQYDLNHDGKLSFFEFGYMFSKTQKHR